MNPVLGGVFVIMGYMCVKHGMHMLRDSLDAAYQIDIKTYRYMVENAPHEKSYTDEVVKTIILPDGEMEHVREAELNARLSLDLHGLVKEGVLRESVVSGNPDETRLVTSQTISDITRQKRLESYPRLLRPLAYL